MPWDVGKLGLGTRELGKPVGTFPLHQGQQGFTQELRTLCQTADFLGLCQQLIVQSQCGSHGGYLYASICASFYDEFDG
jgi:hypothetical protein